MNKDYFRSEPPREYEDPKSDIESVVTLFDSEEEAVEAAKEFWGEMSCREDLPGVTDWGMALTGTSEDRTSVIHDDENGKWQLHIRGNHCKLTKKR